MNPLKGETPLSVEGRELVLVLDHAALIAAERAYGKPLAMTMADAAVGFIGAQAAMLSGALARKHPEITLDDAAGLVIQHGDVVGPALEAAAFAAFGKPEDGEEPRPPKAAPRGTRSGGNGAKRGSTPKASSKPRRGSSASSSARA